MPIIKLIVVSAQTAYNEAVTKKRAIILLVLFAAAVGLVFWLARQSAEPSYQGRSMRTWLHDLEKWNGTTNDPAFIAFREMGTNAIPGLLEILKSGGSAWQKMISKFNRQQSVVQLPLGTSWRRTLAASWALYAMGHNAKPALLALTNLLFSSNALVTSSTALAGIGSDAVPSLLAALTNQNYRIRFSAASGLGWERAELNVIVPALVARLQDSNRNVRIEAALSLGQLHTQPEFVVPALMKDFPGTDSLFRVTVLNSLGNFETNAKAAVPLVVGALKDNDASVRQCASNALEQIDPDAAAKASAK